jgi:ADP-ribose pyrophosphatase YjhB (NUDIX family)
MAGHWALFGGMVERHETPEAALLRELREELRFTPPQAPAFFSQIAFDLGFARHGLQRKLFFDVPVSEDAVRAMTLSEGQAMQFFTPASLLCEERVVPWDLYAVVLYARRAALTAALRRPPARSIE